MARIAIGNLTTATAVTSTTKLVVVQDGGTFQAALSLFPSDTSAVQVDVSLLRIQVSAQASALESINSFGLGVVKLTAAAGTDTEYAATGFYDPVYGMTANWTPAANNGGDAYLTWNDTRKRLRTESGSVLTAGLLRSGVRYQIVYDEALDSFIVLGLFLQPRVQSRNRHMGISATLDFYETTESTVLARIAAIASSGGTTEGQLSFQVGTTASGLSTALQIFAQTTARFYGPILTAGADEVYHLNNPPPFEMDDVGLLIGTAGGFTHEAAVVPFSPPAAGILTPFAGAELNKQGWAGTANSWFDCYPMRIHTTQRIGVKSSVTASFWTGTSTTWANWSTRVMQVVGPAVVEITKFQSQDEMVISAPVGTLVSVSVSTCTIPNYGQVWIIGGQSWMERASFNGAPGVFETYVSLSATRANPSVKFIPAAAGASALLYGSAAVSTNFWWDQRTNVPGPNLLQAASVVADWMIKNPGQPRPTAMLWCYGLNDMTALTSTGDNTPAKWTASQILAQNYLDSAITSLTGVSVSLHHFIAPVPAWQTGTFDEEKWYAQRRAMLQVVADDVRSHRLADAYHLPRITDDEHHDFERQKQWAATWPYFVENALYGGTFYEGPEIIAFTTVSAGEYRARIQRGYIDVSTAAVLNRPDRPHGFGLIPPGSNGDDFIQIGVSIASYSWTTDTPVVGPQDDDILRIFPKTPALQLKLAYPYGSLGEQRQQSRYVKDLRTGLPLKTYHPTV